MAEKHWIEQLRRFAETTDTNRTLLALDLDGTALLEDRGKVFISGSVEKGVKAMHDHQVPIVLNTLRFPLSVIRTIGQEWYQIADVPILTVLLNGSILGYIKCVNNELEYDELAAFPLQNSEIESMLVGIKQLCAAGIDNILLFYYPRDWTKGEVLWTPKAENVPHFKNKYVSASRVFSSDVSELSSQMTQHDICMASLFIDHPEDNLMAYQHAKRNTFFTTKGVDKASGLREIANQLARSPLHALGAGDTEMDTFLSDVGCAVTVGGAKLPYRGRVESIKVETPAELGELIQAYSELLR